ncbi:MAG: tyrosine-type recombinase/integrase [Holosporales bacterium]|jgi:integrase/recombinase XerC|nr:tyrosine-type recombinase/integrase [Holosporales bacterium]
MPTRLRKIQSEWLDSLIFDKSSASATRLAYDSDIRCFLEFYASYTGEDATFEKIIKIEPKDWRAWSSSQRNAGLCSRTISRRFAALKSFFKFLEQNDYIKDHLIFSSKTPKAGKTLPRPATYDEIMLLMDNCFQLPGTPWIHKRDQALIFLIYSVGLRINEALSINCKDIEQTEFLTICGKGMKTRQVPLMPGTMRIINDYKNICPWLSHSQYFDKKSFAIPLFLGEKGKRLVAQVFEARVRALRKILNLPDSFTPHALRHSCATHLMASSEDIRGIQELLGHASLSTTQIYTDINSEQLRTTICRAHPRAKKD